MSHSEESVQGGTRLVLVDLVVALLIFAVGALVAWDSYRLGASWASDGPQAGYFPFRIGLLTCICGIVVAVQSLLRIKTDRAVFVTYLQLKQVMVILIPSVLYVLGVQLIGIYVPSAIFIALFMKFAGSYTWVRSMVVGGGVAVVSFVLFEIWFKIPLPKGPVERMLGY